MMVKNATPRQAPLLGGRPALFAVQMKTAPFAEAVPVFENN
jgi:hypothetical protein